MARSRTLRRELGGEAVACHLTRTLSTEGFKHGIRVNALAPRARTRMSGSQTNMLAEMLSITPEQVAEINAPIGTTPLGG